MSLDKKRREFIIKEIINEKRQIQTVLELGAGKCNILFDLINKHPNLNINYHCLDKNIKFLKKGLKNVSEFKNSLIKYHFWNANIIDLYCKDGLFWLPTNFDLLILSEVIEHLSKDNLNRMKYFIFNLIQSEYVIITTPISSEFKREFHMFEFSKEEFEEFCKSIDNYEPLSFTYLKDDNFESLTQICILRIKNRKIVNYFEYQQEERDKLFIKLK